MEENKKVAIARRIIVTVRCWRENKDIPLPTYAHNGDACCDLYAQSIEYDSDKDRYIVHTGLHISLPEDYECELRPRSSLANTEYYIVNTPGTIDEPYRGEIKVVFKPRTNAILIGIMNNIIEGFNRLDIDSNVQFVYKDIATRIDKYKNELIEQTEFPYKEKERIAQILIRKRQKIEWAEVETLEELGETDRGSNGYGSSGK